MDEHLIDTNWRESARLEDELYMTELPRIYRQALRAAYALYDKACEASDNFRLTSADVLTAEPRIIKIFRFMSAPPTSQKKLGQIIGTGSTEAFEAGRALDRESAARIMQFVHAHVDPLRFPWLSGSVPEDELNVALRYARDWTCSLIANTNADTEWRNWRKRRQEAAIRSVIEAQGFALDQRSDTIRRVADLPAGHYSVERQVAGRPTQKADFSVGLTNGKFAAIEAKAVGVRIDSTKRMKEIRNKHTAWNTEFGRQIEVCAVVAGWIPTNEIQSLLDEGIHVFWEHQLDTFAEFLGHP